MKYSFDIFNIRYDYDGTNFQIKPCGQDNKSCCQYEEGFINNLYPNYLSFNEKHKKFQTLIRAILQFLLYDSFEYILNLSNPDAFTVIPQNIVRTSIQKDLTKIIPLDEPQLSDPKRKKDVDTSNFKLKDKYKLLNTLDELNNKVILNFIDSIVLWYEGVCLFRTNDPLDALLKCAFAVEQIFPCYDFKYNNSGQIWVKIFKFLLSNESNNGKMFNLKQLKLIRNILVHYTNNDKLKKIYDEILKNQHKKIFQNPNIPKKIAYKEYYVNIEVVIKQIITAAIRNTQEVQPQTMEDWALYLNKKIGCNFFLISLFKKILLKFPIIALYRKILNTFGKNF